MKRIVVSKNSKTDIVVAVVEYFLLQCYVDAINCKFEAGRFIVIHLIHGVASVNGHHKYFL